jgi:hypothetical protein
VEIVLQELNRALADIHAIRTQIAAGAAFRGYGPTTVALTGMIGLAAALMQGHWPQLFAANERMFILFWMATGCVCAAAVYVEMQIRSRRLHASLASTLTSQALEEFMPAAVASVFVPLFLLRFAPQSLWMMPGLWQLFVSLGIFASIRNFPRRMSLGAAWFFTSGFVSLLFAAGSTSHVSSPWLMGLPFFFGQVLMAGLLFSCAETGDEKE